MDHAVDGGDRRVWSRFAIASLTCGVAGFLLLPIVGGILGCIFGSLAMREGDKAHGKAGLIVSIASLAGSPLLWVTVFVSCYDWYFGHLINRMQ
jgi:hypothetical protein